MVLLHSVMLCISQLRLAPIIHLLVRKDVIILSCISLLTINSLRSLILSLNSLFILLLEHLHICDCLAHDISIALI